MIAKVKSLFFYGIIVIGVVGSLQAMQSGLSSNKRAKVRTRIIEVEQLMGNKGDVVASKVWKNLLQQCRDIVFQDNCELSQESYLAIAEFLKLTKIILQNGDVGSEIYSFWFNELQKESSDARCFALLLIKELVKDDKILLAHHEWDKYFANLPVDFYESVENPLNDKEALYRAALLDLLAEKTCCSGVVIKFFGAWFTDTSGKIYSTSPIIHSIFCKIIKKLVELNVVDSQNCYTVVSEGIYKFEVGSSFIFLNEEELNQIVPILKEWEETDDFKETGDAIQLENASGGCCIS